MVCVCVCNGEIIECIPLPHTPKRRYNSTFAWRYDAEQEASKKHQQDVVSQKSSINHKENQRYEKGSKIHKRRT